jgi:hypothetical protein
MTSIIEVCATSRSPHLNMMTHRRSTRFHVRCDAFANKARGEKGNGGDTPGNPQRVVSKERRTTIPRFLSLGRDATPLGLTAQTAARPAPESEQRGLYMLRNRGDRNWSPVNLAAPPAEKQEEIPADPLLSLTEVSELPLVLMEAAIVVGAQDVVQVFVMDHRLNEERRDVRRIQNRVNSYLGCGVVV